MKRLERPSGYFSSYDPSTGKKVEGETRQCVHCAYTWIYDPGASFERKAGLRTDKPKIRGTCLRCRGLVCGRPECLKIGCKTIEEQLLEAEGRYRTASGLYIG